MAQIAELRREDKTRRRTTSTMAVLGATLVVAGSGWFAASQLGGSDTPPADPVSTPTPSASAVAVKPGLTVGTHLQPRLVAKAPKSWVVVDNAGSVLLDSNVSYYNPQILIAGPLLKVYDPDRNTGVDIPADGYAQWLREHPNLTVLADRMVLIDGRQYPQLTLKVDDDAPSGYAGVLLGKFDGADVWDQVGWPWDQVLWGAVFTETVIDVDGQIMVVKSSGARNDVEQAELEAALDLVLSTMQLPR